MIETMCMDRLEEISDECLAQRGDTQSFAILAGRYRAKALRIAYGILHDRADAEDAVQEAFIRIYRSLGRFKGAGRFSSWVYRVAVNESLRLLKAKRNSDELQAEHVSVDCMDAERVLLVRECLAFLPEKLRVVLALRGVEELEYAEIALILSVPIGTVRSRLHEARRVFALHWKELMRDEV
jgi:RNA polymerase sigma-70 factor (ECF subfamily)